MAREPELETAIMDLVWDTDGALTPAQVSDKLERTLAYTTVMTVLVRLWKKGLLVRERRGKAYAYRAAVDREAVVAANMIDIVSRAGDAGPVLARFADHLDGAEREYLISLLDLN